MEEETLGRKELNYWANMHHFMGKRKTCEYEELPVWRVTLKIALQVARVEALKDFSISIPSLQQLRDPYHTNNAFALESFGEFITVQDVPSFTGAVLRPEASLLFVVEVIHLNASFGS